jgi:hypothetical protein
MKVKLFREYNSNEYYYEISAQEFKNNYDRNGFLNRDDYDRIVKLKDRYDVEFIYGGDKGSNNYSEINTVFITGGDIVLTVYVGSDEWYYVHCDDDGRFSFYKCDQFDGLLKLISDKL